jgi:hypothetical protein
MTDEPTSGPMTAKDLKAKTLQALCKALEADEGPQPAMVAQAINYLKTFPEDVGEPAYDALGMSPTLARYAGKMGHSALS